MGTAQTSHKKSIAMDLMNYVFYVFVIFCCALKHPILLDKMTEIIIFKKRNIKINKLHGTYFIHRAYLIS